MKAAIFHQKQDIRVEDVPLRDLMPQEVLIRVKFCGVCGTDLHIFHGDEGAATVSPPTILGHEFSGVVEQVGSAVRSVRPGDRVCVDPNNMCGSCSPCRNGQAHFCENVIGYGTTTHGGFAEKMIVAEKVVYRIADSLSFQEAAMTETVSCCVHGMDLCSIQEGSTVLIIGGGPIGLLMVQLARLAGAASIILSEPVAEKRALGQKLGADFLVNPLEEDLQEYCRQKHLLIHTVIECVGNPHTIAQGIRCAGQGATVMLFGLTTPQAEISIKPFEIFQKELHITSSFINPYTFERALRLLESGRVQVRDIITDIVPLENIVSVFTDDRYRQKGKVLIQL